MRTWLENKQKSPNKRDANKTFVFSRPFIIILDFFPFHLPNKLSKAFPVVTAWMRQKPPNLNFISSLKYVIRRKPSATQSIRLSICLCHSAFPLMRLCGFIILLFMVFVKGERLHNNKKNININLNISIDNVSKLLSIFICVQHCCGYTKVFE